MRFWPLSVLADISTVVGPCGRYCAFCSICSVILLIWLFSSLFILPTIADTGVRHLACYVFPVRITVACGTQGLRRGTSYCKASTLELPPTGTYAWPVSTWRLGENIFDGSGWGEIILVSLGLYKQCPVSLFRGRNGPH